MNKKKPFWRKKKGKLTLKELQDLHCIIWPHKAITKVNELISRGVDPRTAVRMVRNEYALELRRVLSDEELDREVFKEGEELPIKASPKSVG